MIKFLQYTPPIHVLFIRDVLLHVLFKIIQRWTNFTTMIFYKPIFFTIIYYMGYMPSQMHNVVSFKIICTTLCALLQREYVLYNNVR